MKSYLNRRRLLVGAGMRAIGTVVVVGAAPVTVFAADKNDGVERNEGAKRASLQWRA
jgi:hypothetical protein